MSGIHTAAVAGLGLIGGSLARDLAARGVRVLGYDAGAGVVDAAVAEGVVSAALGPGLEGVEDADVLVLALPVRAAPALLEAALPRLGSVRLITDGGSTKAGIVAAARRLGLGASFVGAHPLAGDHRSGWAASRIGLFTGARVYLTPSGESSPGALALARELWRRVGGRPVEISAEEHDRLLAWTSHLPQVASSAVAAALAGRGIAPAELGRGGEDVTRLAGSSPEMWRDILADNAAAVTEAIAEVERQLAAARVAIHSGDAEAIRAWLAESRRWAVERP
ncbi:MAG TPA: prephenate dehydrogenase [Longimicrobium sp.]|nr:prephenate dehydrogenase [Longimicrobium sp.]